MTMNRFQVTPGKAWRDKVAGGVVLPLPSGFVARVRSIQPDVLIKLGRIPDSLTPLVAAVLEGNTPQDPGIENPKERASYLEFVDVVTRYAFVNPRVVDDPQTEDEIGIDHVEWCDKVFLLNSIGATTHQLESFRDEQERNLDAVDAAKRNASASQPDHADPAMGETD